LIYKLFIQKDQRIWESVYLPSQTEQTPQHYYHKSLILLLLHATKKGREMAQVGRSFFVKGKAREIIKLFQKVDFYCSQSPGVLLKKHHSQRGFNGKKA